MQKILYDRLFLLSKATCTYDAFAESYGIQIPTVFISNYYRRQTREPYDICGLTFYITLKPRGIIADKVETWKAEGKNEFQIADELSKEVYVGSLINYIEMNLGNIAILVNEYGITCGFIPPSFVTYSGFLEEKNCQAEMNVTIRRLWGEETNIDFHRMIVNAY